jgi:hypothetical protein
MHEAMALTLLQRWQNFYVVVGSAAAALTGLQFVVLAVITQMRMRNSAGGIDAFSTPTIVYFCTSLLLAAVACAPWNGLLGFAAIVTACGAAGTVYAAIVTRRARRQSAYRLVLEDWLWHVILPLSAHLMLLAAGLALPQRPAPALFTIAAAALLLLFIGIHNAWDAVTYMVVQRLESDRHGGDRQGQGPPPG